MHHALAVGVAQRLQHLGDEMQGLLPGQGAAPQRQVLFQRNAVHVLHHHVLNLIRHRYIVHFYNAWMVQDGNGLGFIFEAAHHLFALGALFLQNFHRDRALFLQVHGPVDVGHAALAHQLFQQVTAVQLFTDQIVHFTPP